MNTTPPDNENGNDNLVMFPSSKNFKLNAELSDPLMELLNEYSHITDAELPDYLDERFEESLDDDTVYGSLEAFMSRNQNQEVLTPDDKLINLINARLKSIKEAKQRIKFYLEEIEMFLPRRR